MILFQLHAVGSRRNEAGETKQQSRYKRGPVRIKCDQEDSYGVLYYNSARVIHTDPPSEEPLKPRQVFGCAAILRYISCRMFLRRSQEATRRSGSQVWVRALCLVARHFSGLNQLNICWIHVNKKLLIQWSKKPTEDTGAGSGFSHHGLIEVSEKVNRLIFRRPGRIS